jgi:hypothetical protein
MIRKIADFRGIEVDDFFQARLRPAFFGAEQVIG